MSYARSALKVFLGTMSVVVPLSAAAVPPAHSGAGATAILEREHQYTAALLEGDTRLLAPVLADSFVDTSESGVLRNKRELLAVVARQAPPGSITESDRRIQIYGSTAVVTVKFDVKGTDHGKPYESIGRATDVWIKRAGTWYCVAAHSSAVG
jgi:hypothetical protein